MNEPLLMYENRKMTKLKRLAINRREYHTVLANNTTVYAICGQTNDWPILQVDLKSFETRPLKLD